MFNFKFLQNFQVLMYASLKYFRDGLLVSSKSQLLAILFNTLFYFLFFLWALIGRDYFVSFLNIVAGPLIFISFFNFLAVFFLISFVLLFFASLLFIVLDLGIFLGMQFICFFIFLFFIYSFALSLLSTLGLTWFKLCLALFFFSLFVIPSQLIYFAFSTSFIFFYHIFLYERCWGSRCWGSIFLLIISGFFEFIKALFNKVLWLSYMVLVHKIFFYSFYFWYMLSLFNFHGKYFYKTLKINWCNYITLYFILNVLLFNFFNFTTSYPFSLDVFPFYSFDCYFLFFFHWVFINTSVTFLILYEQFISGWWMYNSNPRGVFARLSCSFLLFTWIFSLFYILFEGILYDEIFSNGLFFYCVLLNIPSCFILFFYTYYTYLLNHGHPENWVDDFVFGHSTLNFRFDSIVLSGFWFTITGFYYLFLKFTILPVFWLIIREVFFYLYSVFYVFGVFLLSSKSFFDSR